MTIFNLNFSNENFLKIIFTIIAICIISLFAFISYKIYFESVKVRDELSQETIKISEKNYTNILKSVTENLDEHVGKKICFTGYMYRAVDFTENEFVLARDMLIGENRSVVVRFHVCK